MHLEAVVLGAGQRCADFCLAVLGDVHLQVSHLGRRLVRTKDVTADRATNCLDLRVVVAPLTLLERVVERLDLGTAGVDPRVVGLAASVEVYLCAVLAALDALDDVRELLARGLAGAHGDLLLLALRRDLGVVTLGHDVGEFDFTFGLRGDDSCLLIGVGQAAVCRAGLRDRWFDRDGLASFCGVCGCCHQRSGTDNDRGHKPDRQIEFPHDFLFSSPSGDCWLFRKGFGLAHVPG